MSQEEFWGLGLFEGEGCIYIRKNKPQAHLFVRMTDLDVLEKFQSIVGGKINRCTPPANNRHKQAWRWEMCSKADVKALLTKWLPYFSARRAYVAANAIARIDKT